MKKLLALLLAVMLVVGLCACGSDKGSSTPADVSGRYYLVSLSEGGETLNVEDYAAMMGDELECYIDMYAGGTAYMFTREGDYTSADDMEWGNGKMWPEGEPDDSANLSISGNTLTLSNEGRKMVFKKN